MVALVESMAYVGQVPWHGLGESVTDEEDKLDTKRFIVRCGTDWSVHTEQLYLKDGRESGCVAVVRDTDKRILGSGMGERYEPLQNIDAFDFFQPFLDAGECTMETGGSLRGGEIIWALARCGDPLEIIADDIIEQFLLLAHGHNGSLSIDVRFTPTRVVCANTLAVALDSKLSQWRKVRHTRGAKTRLADIAATIDITRRVFKDTAQQYKTLTLKKMRIEDVEKYVEQVLQLDVSKSTRAYNIVDNVVELFRTNDTCNTKGAAGTMWGAYNAVTHYLSHDVGRSADTRLTSAWFGANANANKRALELAIAA